MLVARMEGNGTLETVARMRTIFVHDGFQQEGARKALEDLELAFAEIAANAIRHAGRKPDSLAVALHLEGNGFRVTFHDDGSPFDGFSRLWRESAMAPMDATNPRRGLRSGCATRPVAISVAIRPPVGLVHGDATRPRGSDGPVVAARHIPKAASAAVTA